MNRIFVICASFILIIGANTLSHPQVQGAIIYDWHTTTGSTGVKSTIHLEDSTWDDKNFEIHEILSWDWQHSPGTLYTEKNIDTAYTYTPILLGPQSIARLMIQAAVYTSTTNDSMALYTENGDTWVQDSEELTMIIFEC